MNKLLLYYGLIVFASSGFLSFVDAETLTIEVPFDYNKSGCTLTSNATDYKFYDCYASYQKFNATSFVPDLVWDEVDKEYKTPEQLEQEAKADYQIWLDDQSTFEDPFLQAQSGNLGDSSSDELASKFIDNYIGGKCYQGAAGTTTAGLQDENSFEIPTIDVAKWVNGEKIIVQVLDRSQTTNEDLKGIVGYIIAHQQECIAEEKLLDEEFGILSIVDKNFAFCDDVPNTSVSFNPMCGKVYADHSVIASDIPIWTQDRANQEANFGVEQNHFSIEEDICHGYYGLIYKMTFQECRDLFELENPPESTTDPTELTNYGAEIEAKVEQYKLDNGEQMAKEALDDKISQKIRDLLEQKRKLEALRNQ